ncbi:matrilin-2-like [Watersipora subatra]|uniref:matrilin-2-like n=1 Tax=Watersipora subatra TaxID=2589382 RepID=UPI00355C8730
MCESVDGRDGIPGRDVDDINECMTDNGRCEDVCINTIQGYYCACSAGTTLIAPDTVNCDEGTLYCDNYYYYGTLCYCKVNTIVQLVNGTNCTGIDECLVNNGGCEHVCEDTSDSFLCSCQFGYALAPDQFSCRDINECDMGFNVHGCEGSCVNTDGGYYCECAEHLEIGANEIDIFTEEIAVVNCVGYPVSHLDSFRCSNRDYGLQYCECPDATDGAVYKLVENTGGCLESNVRCDWHYNFFYTCNCFVSQVIQSNELTTALLTLNGTKCNARDECLINNGGCEHICTDTPTGFECSCFPPPSPIADIAVWTLSENGFDCLDIDECSNATWRDLNCASPAICVNTPGFWECTATVGLSKSGELNSLESKSVSPLTLGMMGWAAVMTLTVGIIIAAVIVRQKRTSAPDVESSMPNARLTIIPGDHLTAVHRPQALHNNADQHI